MNHTPSDKNNTTPWMQNLVNIASICSAVITSFRLYMLHIISIKTAILFIFAVLVFVALGKNFTKVLLVLIAFILFVLLYGGPTKEGIYSLAQSMIVLFIICGALYMIIRNNFGKQ